jgi:branched-chain amino acid transport system substrate-binding protein
MLATALVAVVALAACAYGASAATTVGTVDIYSSLPLQGAGKNQMIAMTNGIKLALAQRHDIAGKFKVKYVSLDDSTAAAGNWDPAQVATDARTAARDPKTIIYIGEFNSGASALSIPVLNQAGVPQISPTNTYVGLTTNEPGSAPGEPQKYYPTGKRTYVRIAPRDSIQGAAMLAAMKQDKCTKVAVANDRDTFGVGLAKILELKAKSFGLNIVSNEGIDKTAPNFRSYADSVKASGADCFAFAGVTANGGVQVTKDVATAVPNAKLYGPDGTCESGFTNPAKGGLPANFASRFQCTIATLNLKSYPGGARFLAAYKAKYHVANPDPYAIYGYEAMDLAMSTIASLGNKGNNRQAFLHALFTRTRHGVLGTYRFDKNGDSTLTAYGLYKIGPDGNPLFERVINAKATGA